MSHPQPIPCAQCGTNFMRHNLDPEFPKLCNNCMYRAQQTQPRGVNKDMSMMNILIEVDRQTNIEIEEICMNEGITISAYFKRLHSANISKGWVQAPGYSNADDFEEKFESMAHESKETPKFAEVPQKTPQKKGKK